jgi:hypothetical protein
LWRFQKHIISRRLQRNLHNNNWKLTILSVLAKPKQDDKDKCSHGFKIVTRKVSDHHLHHEQE